MWEAQFLEVKLNKINVGVIGAGNMGEAILRGLQGIKDFSVYVFEKNEVRAKKIAKKYNIKKSTLKQLTKQSNIIIICVKPQDIDSLLLSIKEDMNSGQLVVSIAAGITTKHIEKGIGDKVAVLRVMPNLPGLIGQGVSALCLGKYAGSKHYKVAGEIFQTLGEIIKVKENKMDAITAISGSGPGFYAYYINALQEAAVEIGLSKKEAKFLAVNAAAGTANMLLKTEMEPAVMVKRVASPGGTTEAGLRELDKAKVKLAGKKTVKAAQKRAKELSK